MCPSPAQGTSPGDTGNEAAGHRLPPERVLGRGAFPPSGFCSNNRRGDGLRTRASCIFMNPTFAQTTAPACFSVFRQNGRLSSSGLSKARADWLGLRRRRCSGWHGIRGRPRSGVCTAHLLAGGSCSDVSSEAAVGPVVDTVLLGCDLPALQRRAALGTSSTFVGSSCSWRAPPATVLMHFFLFKALARQTTSQNQDHGNTQFRI